MYNDRRIYLASPYSSEDAKLRMYRHRLAQHFTQKHLEQGLIMFSPIVNGVALTKNDERIWGFAHWHDYDLSFLRQWATELWVMCIDGWKESVGVQEEIRTAEEIGLPVRYLEAEE